MDKSTAKSLDWERWKNDTDDPEFNYVSHQHSLAHEWLKSIKKCKCKLNPTSDDCKHIRRALKKLYGKQIDKMWNETLRKGIANLNTIYGFEIPFGLQKALSADNRGIK